MTGQNIRPITLGSLPRMVWRTIRSDLRHNHGAPEREMTMGRVLHSIRPRLAEPVFIIGAPRSGTTFLGNCLGTAHAVSYHHEPIATKAASRYVYERIWSQRRLQFLFRGVYRWLQRVHFDGDLLFVEKTPRNSLIVDFLHETFPQARFIHIVRDGRDAALSYSKKPWLRADQAESGLVGPGGYPYGPTPRYWVESDRREEFESTSDIHRCIWGWRRHTESALDRGRALPAHLYHELRYEDLVSDPDLEGRRILDFMGLASDTNSSTAFLDAVRKASPSSVGAWRRELNDGALEQINTEAGRLLAELDYI